MVFGMEEDSWHEEMWERIDIRGLNGGLLVEG